MNTKVTITIPKGVLEYAREIGFNKISRYNLQKEFNMSEQEARFWAKTIKIATFEEVSSGIVDPFSPLVRAALIRYLRKPKTIEYLSNKLSLTNQQVESLIESLKQSGYSISKRGGLIELTRGISSGENYVIDPKKLWGRRLRFGVVSDTHLASKYERLDVLEYAYDYFAKEKITSVYHAGNLVDGEATFNKYELKAHGITDQTLYALDYYPQRTGITTYYITADDHEGWWQQREGIDFGRYLTLEAKNRGREDLVHLGYQEVDIELKAKNGKAIMRLLHPGGGSAYAISYALQKIVESFQGGNKPNIIICGHYHKSGVFHPREVNCVLAGTLEDQTRFMRKNKLQAHLGFYDIELVQADDGSITQFRTNWHPFFDKKVYAVRSI